MQLICLDRKLLTMTNKLGALF